MKPLQRQMITDIRVPQGDAWWDRIIPLLVQKRQVIFLSVVFILLIVEVVEHFLIARFTETIHMYFDAVFYAILVPAGTWLMLALLEKTEKDRARAEKLYDLRSQFSQELGDAGDWDSLVASIARFPCKVLARTTSTLFVMNPVTMHMEPEAACTPDGEVTLRPEVDINPDSLPLGSLSQLLVQNSSFAEFSSGDGKSVKAQHRYDLAITRNEQQIAVLKLEFPTEHGPSVEEMRMLKSAAPVIGLALEGAILQAVAADQAAASEAERQHIAQNLHDTLAQNISYLRLKLDQLTGENAIREIGGVLQELERMRSTADEAYQQVRNTLAELNPIQPTELTTMVLKQAQTICKRAGINLRTNQVGTPFALSPDARQQILYIAREALHNVEKHAKASKVTIQYLWLESELIVKIDDDGVGFDPRNVTNEGHYGLWIMQHRAQEIGGTLKVARLTETCGTEVTLWVPRSSFQPAAESRPTR